MDGAANSTRGALGVDRPTELDLLRRMLAEAAAGSPRFVLVKGERGMGKTSLLQTFVGSTVDDVRWLQARGDESEAFLPYCMLEGLARSAEPSLPFELPVLTHPLSSRGDPVAMGTALLDMLGTLQRIVPVVLVVDDAHVCDVQSLFALLFAFRRLRTTRVLVVMSASDDGCWSLPDGLRRIAEGETGMTISLAGFDDQQMRNLIAGLGVGPLSPRAVRRLRRHTGGNPLYVRSLIDEVGVGALGRLDDTPWPAPRSFSGSVHDRLAACPSDARRLVAAAAVLGERCPLTLVRQLAGIGRPLDALQAAIDACLIEYQNREVAFPCPLVWASVYHCLAISERAELHSLAAKLVSEEGAVLRHRVAATTEQDEGLASAVEAFAVQESARSAWTSAAAFFEESARLRPAGHLQEGSVLGAVECLLMAGESLAARSLSAGVEGFADVARSRYLLGRIALLDGHLEEAGRLLAGAREASDVDVDAVLASKIALELASLNLHLLRPQEAIAWAEQAMSAARGTPLAQRPLPSLAFGLATTGQATRALEAVRSSPVPAEDAGPELASYLMAGALALLHAGATDGARVDATRLVSVASRSGPLLAHVIGLALLATTEYRLGAWNDSIVHAEQAASISMDAEHASSQSLIHATATWPRAGRGEWDAAELHATRAAAAARCPMDVALARMADAVVGRARGQHQRVVDSVTALRSLAAPGVVDEPGGLWPWQELYVDALIALGLLENANEELVRFEATAASGRGPAVMSTACRLRGSLEMARGRTREAETAFRAAARAMPNPHPPFDRGLLHASYGAFLRRCGKRTAAAAELKAAREMFARLGARPFLERCDRELASTGLTVHRRRDGRSSQLTPREVSVARLVREGKRNREVASELVISENTIEYHLKNIFAKLGVASRSQLIVRLGIESAEDHRGSPGLPRPAEP